MLGSKSKRYREDKRAEYTKLSCRAEEQGFGVGYHGTEVRHSAYAHKYQAGIQTRFDAYVEDVEESAVLQDVHIINAVCYRRVARPVFRVEYHIAFAKDGEVGKQHTESYTYQQERFKFLFDAEIQEYARKYKHDGVLPMHICKAGRIPQIGKHFSDIHFE